jgi:hypothetical protein
MKKIVAIVLFLGVLFQSMSKLIVIVNFEIHRDYIAKNLCENRDKPKMCCKGKCQLRKQLNNTENEDTKNKISHRFTFDDYVCTDIKPLQIRYIPETIIKTKTGILSQEYSFDPLLSIFHPPQV